MREEGEQKNWRGTMNCECRWEKWQYLLAIKVDFQRQFYFSNVKTPKKKEMIKFLGYQKYFAENKRGTENVAMSKFKVTFRDIKIYETIRYNIK